MLEMNEISMFISATEERARINMAEFSQAVSRLSALRAYWWLQLGETPVFGHWAFNVSADEIGGDPVRVSMPGCDIGSSRPWAVIVEGEVLGWSDAVDAVVEAFTHRPPVEGPSTVPIIGEDG